jgi:D-alanyl-D-alanine carboxypeptidase
MALDRSHRAAALLALLASSALLASCTMAPGESAATPTSSPTTAPTSSPEEEQMTVRVDEAELAETMDRLAEEMHIPGAVMLLRTPDGEITHTYGVRELGGDVPVTVDDHIRVGSNTKTMTGTVILQLVQEGAIALEDPVSDYRPDVPGGEDISIADLLNMRSGLYNYSETYELNAALDETPDRQWTAEELVAIGLSLPPYFEPDTGWHYSNTNTVLLGLIAEAIDGKPINEIFQDRLFTPFGLDETSMPASGSDMPEPYSRGYMYTDNVFTIASTKLPADLQAAAATGELLPNDQTFANPSWTNAAGEVISTAGDLADWAEILVKGEALDADVQKLRLDSLQGTGDQPDSPRYGYALAEMGPLKFLGHTGELPGYNSFMGHHPDTGVTLIVWSNLAPSAAGTDPAVEIAKALMGSLYSAG